MFAVHKFKLLLGTFLYKYFNKLRNGVITVNYKAAFFKIYVFTIDF